MCFYGIDECPDNGLKQQCLKQKAQLGSSMRLVDHRVQDHLQQLSFTTGDNQAVADHLQQLSSS